MVRDVVGLVTLAGHEDGGPQAVATYDQKEGAERCELKAAQELLESIPALDGKTVTADALRCQAKTARTVVGKGGDYLLQVKGNQPGMLGQAKAHAAAGSPFFSEPTSKKDA